MNDVNDFIQSVKKLKLDCPMTVIVLPPCTKGLPLGSYNLELLLKSIVMNLEGKKPLCREGSDHDRIKIQTHYGRNKCDKVVPNLS